MLSIDLLKKIIENAKTCEVYSIKTGRFGRTYTEHVIKVAEELKLIKIEEKTSLYGRSIQVVTLTDEYKKLLKPTD